MSVGTLDHFVDSAKGLWQAPPGFSLAPSNHSAPSTTRMLRRIVLLLLVFVLPAQALAGAFVHVCRHDLAAAAPAIQAAPAGGHEHCPMSVDAAGPAAMPDAAPADPGAQPCDDCGGCHQAAYSLPALPAPLVTPDFSSVKLTGPTAPVSSRVPALPDRPPNTAAA